MLSIIIACDHAGFDLACFLSKELSSYNIVKVGAKNNEKSVDYPQVVKEAANLLKDKANYGIFICGSGIGVSIMANRYSFIRAALCFDEVQARLAKEHNNANVICLGARIISPEIALSSVKIFLRSEFAGGRHEKRVRQLSIENQ